MDPSSDILTGANRHIYAVGAGLTITGSDGASVSLCPIDHPWSVLYARDLEVSLDFCSQEAGGFPQSVQQPMEYELPLLVFRYLEFTSTHLVWRPNSSVPALETMVPLLASAGSGARGPLPSSQSGVSVVASGRAGHCAQAESKGKVNFLRVWDSRENPAK